MLVPKVIHYYTQMWGYHHVVASLRINQIYIKIDIVKIKLYLHQNHFIGSISLFVDCFHLQEQPNSSQCHFLYLDLLLLLLLICWSLLFSSCFKGALSGLRWFLANESPLKMMKNAFYFTLEQIVLGIYYQQKFVILYCLD